MKLVIMIALAAGIACERTSSEPPKPLPASPGDGVQLLSVGGAQKTLLQYRMKKGAHTTLEMDLDMDLEMPARPTRMPTITMVVDIGVVDVLPDGIAKLELTVKDTRITDRPNATIDAASLESMKQLLGGMTYAFSLAPDGRLDGGKVTGGGQAAPVRAQLEDMARSMEQVALRLPSVPIGVGASWTTKRSVIQNGIQLTTVTTTQLTKVTADSFDFTSQTTLSAPDQSIVQQGVHLDVKDLGGGGTGKGTVNLTTLAMTGEMRSEFRNTVTAGGQTSAMRVVMAMRLK